VLADFTVRFASTTHASQIATMSRDHIESGLGWRWTEERVRAAMSDDDTNVVVVLDRATGKIVQGFGIMSYAERHAHLLLLAVRPQQRRKGVASAIVSWLDLTARVAGVERILVECRRSNDAARNFYLDHGFHERNIRAGMYRQLEDGIQFAKWLRAPTA